MQNLRLVNALYIDDHPKVDVLRSVFSREQLQADIVLAQTTGEALSIIKDPNNRCYERFNVVFLDFDLRGRNAIELGLVRLLTTSGFGKEGKPLIGCSLLGNSRKRMLKAGCTEAINLNNEAAISQVCNLLRQ